MQYRAWMRGGGFYGKDSFYLAYAYSFYSELNADDQLPRPGTLKKSPLFEFHCEVSARFSCHGNSISPMDGSTGIWPKCRLDLCAFFFLNFRDSCDDSGIRWINGFPRTLFIHILPSTPSLFLGLSLTIHSFRLQFLKSKSVHNMIY